MGLDDWVEGLRAELRGSSDRSIAIVAAAILEDELVELLHAHLTAPPELASELLSGRTRPTFERAIDLATRSDLIDETSGRTLTAIRVIRNRFAHVRDPITFDSQDIGHRLKNLIANLNQKSVVSESNREAFLRITLNLIHGLALAIANASLHNQHHQKSGKVRLRYFDPLFGAQIVDERPRPSPPNE